jgi:hypothetical protein
MQRFGGALGFLIAINGVSGLIHEWLGWFRIWAAVRYFDFLDGYEVVANIALILIGVVVMMAAHQVRKPTEPGPVTRSRPGHR